MGLFLQSIVNSFIQGGFFALWAVGLVLVFVVIVGAAHDADPSERHEPVAADQPAAEIAIVS